MHRLGLSLRNLVMAAGVVCAWACSDDDLDPTPRPDAGHRAPMRCPDGLQPFTIGEEHGLMEEDAASGIRARLVDSSHAMPFNGFNDWTLAITDLDGEPLVDARLNWACAFMPSHKHGSQPRRVEIPQPGQVLLAAQNMAMEGVWEVKLWIQATAEGPEFVPQERRGLAFDRGACTPKNGLDAMSTLTFEVCVPVLHD
jgi:hypothetical protein